MYEYLPFSYLQIIKNIPHNSSKSKPTQVYISLRLKSTKSTFFYQITGTNLIHCFNNPTLCLKMIHHHHHLSRNREGNWGTTNDFTTSFFLFSLFSTALWDLANSRPVHSLMLSSPFHCALQDGFDQTWQRGDMTIPLQFESLYDGQEVFVWSDCLLDFGTDFLVNNMVFVWDA